MSLQIASIRMGATHCLRRSPLPTLRKRPQFVRGRRCRGRRIGNLGGVPIFGVDGAGKCGPCHHATSTPQLSSHPQTSDFASSLALSARLVGICFAALWLHARDLDATSGLELLSLGRYPLRWLECRNSVRHWMRHASCVSRGPCADSTRGNYFQTSRAAPPGCHMKDLHHEGENNIRNHEFQTGNLNNTETTTIRKNARSECRNSGTTVNQTANDGLEIVRAQ